MAALAAVALAACGGGGFFGSSSRGMGQRVVQPGQPVPKGGGVYKLGSPYHDANGRRYVPREEPGYDRTGIASWYGEDYHGRRTANGEIYDMEALTAAHPTLPLPCFARVTNPRNGRSLVVRVNDRGPFIDGRIIDLSWGVASLLQLDAAGTGPVRVQHLGPAPLNGDDSYERRVLAGQPWAGPQVAQSPSPAKALRAREATASAWPAAVATPYQNGGMWPDAPPGWQTSYAPAQQTPPQYWPPSGAPMPAPPRPKFIFDRLPQTAPQPLYRSHPMRPAALHASLPQTEDAPWPRRKTKPRASDTSPVRAAAAPSKAAPRAAKPPKQMAALSVPVPQRRAAAGPVQQPVQQTSAPQSPAQPLYVEAGVFPERATADKLAGILNEIAPVKVELATSGTAIVHRLRLGPFEQNETAQSVIERIRSAGLTKARLLAAHEI